MPRLGGTYPVAWQSAPHTLEALHYTGHRQRIGVPLPVEVLRTAWWQTTGRACVKNKCKSWDCRGRLRQCRCCDSRPRPLAPSRSGKVRMAEFRSFKADAAPEKPDVAGERRCSLLCSRRKARCPRPPAGCAAKADACPCGCPPRVSSKRSPRPRGGWIQLRHGTPVSPHSSSRSARYPSRPGRQAARACPPDALETTIASPFNRALWCGGRRLRSPGAVAALPPLDAWLDRALVPLRSHRSPQQRDACQRRHHAGKGAQDWHHHLRRCLQGRRRAWR